MTVPTPVVATGPLQPSDPVPPPAVQEVAFALDQVSKVDCPVSSAAGVATNASTLAGNGASVALTVVELEVVPPGPEQVSV